MEEETGGEEEDEDNICLVCGDINRPEMLLQCSGCELGIYHYDCLKPPLNTKPEGKWLCPRCVGKKRRRPKLKAGLGGSETSSAVPRKIKRARVTEGLETEGQSREVTEASGEPAEGKGAASKNRTVSSAERESEG
ncbi:unnamed protein product [Choristocarpus tenellus]